MSDATETKPADAKPALVITIPRITLPKIEMPKLAIPKIAMPKIPVPSRRLKRRAALAASFAFAAAIGAAAATGTIAGRTPAASPVNVAALEQRDEAMGKTIERLNKEIAALKSNVEASSRDATTKIAKMSDRITERVERIEKAAAAPDVTNSIPTPQPKPVAETKEPPKVMRDWHVVQAGGGVALVEGPNGIYEIAAGEPLPGLGRVEAVKRQDGRWVVTTPKGIIVSMRQPPRPYYERY